jgi:SAM-dependent methyltransferase
MDVVDFREFYAGRLGHVARRLVAHRLRTRFKGVRGQTVLGLGYAVPYLDGWREEAERIIAFMPAARGVLHWPQEGAGLTALVDDSDLPLLDGSIDVALVVHEIELSEQLPHMLRELWRVLAPQGRVLFIVPNRRGMWARFDWSPFGHGRPFSKQQLTEILRSQNFAPTGWANALFVPPFDRGFFIRSAPAWERIGLWVSPGFSGILIVEAVKQVYAASRVRKRKLVPKFEPQIAPVPALRRAPTPPGLPAR